MNCETTVGTVSWTRNGGEQLSEKEDLVIGNAVKLDEGMYSCHGQYQDEEMVESAEVTVSGFCV